MGIFSQVSTAHSAASEAIFSNSGQVKKRIRNYETTIVDTSDSVLVFPPQANSSDIDIPSVLETVTEISSDSDYSFKKPVRFSTVLVSFIIVITFSWSIHSLFFTIKRENLAFDDVTRPGSIPDVEYSNLAELKLTADRLLENSAWKAEDINSFLSNWNRLGDGEMRKVTKSSWYQLLEFNVKKHLNQKQASANNSKFTDINDQSLLTLGLVMGILEQPGKSKQSTGTPSRYEALLAELTSELKQAEKLSVEQNSNHESETMLNVKLREKYALPKQDLPEKNTPVATVTSEKTPISAPVRVSSRTTDIENNPRIKRHDVESVISDYKRAYEQGDLKMMAELFGATSHSSAEFQKVKSSFDSTFKNTLNRSMNFYDIKTESNGTSAIIEGKFNASVEFKNGKGTQYTVAKMKLHVSRQDNRVVINQVNILDRKVNIVETDRNLITSSNGMLTAMDNKVSIPTAAELQDITTQLVSAYEAGNLKQFISLFSSEVKTNDRIDLTGVKQDYEQLFATTSDRQMFIQNLKWSNETIGAKGTGDLEVVILSNEGNPVYSMEGKIQIIAQKIDSMVKITHLYHIERPK